MDKNLKKKIRALYNLVIEEAEKNEEFVTSLEKIFSGEAENSKDKNTAGAKRGSNRRDQAVLDPIKLAEDGNLTEEVLKPLTEKELKDIVAEYGMDPSKLAMKWKNKERLIRLILDTSFRRASKGDAFRS